MWTEAGTGEVRQVPAQEIWAREPIPHTPAPTAVLERRLVEAAYDFG